MRLFLTISLLLFSTITNYAQTPPTISGEKRLASFEQRKAQKEESIAGAIPFQPVGPTVFGGRIVDLAVNPEDPTIFYAAYASGGLWKTENNGMSFEPIFDKEAVITIGDIAVNWRDSIIWVGTGENNSSRSSYSGVGMYKSTDHGESWQHMGLPESHHIGRIVLHPTNPDVLWVAVLGHLYSPNEERGIYKTTDGGKTWTKTLFVHENAGAVDMIIDPVNPDILYAAFWERERRAWNFVESGVGSGIHKSTDGGETWTLLTQPEGAFPTGEGVGRIGLAIYKNKGKTVLYASVDNYDRRPEEDVEKEEGLTKNDLKEMRRESFLNLPKDDLENFLKGNDFPEKYDAEKIKAMVKSEEIEVQTLVNYLEDANQLLFDTPVVGAQIYRSDDEGKTWQKTHEGYLDDLYFSYGYYFGQIRVSPHNENRIYIVGVPILISEDGGKTFESINGDNVHVDHHALWLNPEREGHVILGNDGGVNISYDDGQKWIKCNSPAVGQFYTVNVDLAKPYNIYGGLQDNGTWAGSSNYKLGSTSWHGSGKYPYQRLGGGDGMQVQIDTRDNNTIYLGFQFGYYYRVNKATGQRKKITPKHKLTENPLRWNWQSPIHLSAHNQDIIYMGSQKLHRSFDQGKSFHDLSKDLTKGGKKGDVPYGTLTTIHESPFRFGLLYTGSDDGLVHVSKDGGYSWQNISNNLEPDMWVSRVIASQHDEATVYVALNGYRWDNFNPYLYVSKDYGANWESIATTLPVSPINVIKEDPVNKNILYVGNDHGLYVSIDRGKNFMPMGNDLPAVPVHDLVIHPDAKEIVIGTHGRSFYKADVAHLQEINEEILERPIFVFDMKNEKYSNNWGNAWSKWAEKNKPEKTIVFYAKDKSKGSLKVYTGNRLLLNEFDIDVAKGLNYFNYDLSVAEKYKEAYAKVLSKEAKRGKKEYKPYEAAEDGIFYLRPGKIMVEVITPGKIERKESEVIDEEEEEEK